MSTALRPSSRDAAIEAAFGHSIQDLHQQQAIAPVAPAVHRMLEMRSFLTTVENRLEEVRHRIHTATAPGQDPVAADLAVDLQWLASATRTRDQYRQAIDQLLRTMPASSARSPFARPTAVAAPARPAATAQAGPAGRRMR
ncbi:hypothetical protein ACFY1P_09310 [Streptomyces sp. NPDC001407]|uniref:hypothetical protein n=1 Tax=Streptomyces sp. NPDC001407 TaxID=3364573 RepID=UPI0036C7B0F7